MRALCNLEEINLFQISYGMGRGEEIACFSQKCKMEQIKLVTVLNHHTGRHDIEQQQLDGFHSSRIALWISNHELSSDRELELLPQSESDRLILSQSIGVEEKESSAYLPNIDSINSTEWVTSNISIMDTPDVIQKRWSKVSLHTPSSRPTTHSLFPSHWQCIGSAASWKPMRDEVVATVTVQNRVLSSNPLSTNLVRVEPTKENSE